MLVFVSQGLSSWHKKFIPKLCFFKTPSWRPLFMILCSCYMENVDFETHSRSTARPNGTQNRPSGYEICIFLFYKNVFFSVDFWWVLLICSPFISFSILLRFHLAPFSFTVGILFNVFSCFEHRPLNRTLFRLRSGCLLLFIQFGFRGAGCINVVMF